MNLTIIVTLIYNDRKKLMEIDNSLVGLSMEFEKQNEVVTDWEAEKARKKANKRGSVSSGNSPFYYDGSRCFR